MLAEAAEPLARARANGVVGMICVGTDLPTSHHALELAQRHPDVWATVGLHPHDASRLAAEWGQLEALTHADEVVAIGEAGFDLYYEHSPKDEQETAFRWQIRLAHRLDLPLVIHTRDAWDDTFRVLTEEEVPARTVFHCWSGGPAEAERALALGAYLSFSGIVSFKNADDVKAAAAIAPLDRVLGGDRRAVPRARPAPREAQRAGVGRRRRDRARRGHRARGRRDRDRDPGQRHHRLRPGVPRPADGPVTASATP